MCRKTKQPNRNLQPCEDLRQARDVKLVLLKTNLSQGALRQAAADVPLQSGGDCISLTFMEGLILSY